jgi:hypothetical protein
MHVQTHSLTAEQFSLIVSKPCYYCGKKSDPPNHHNGLDRLDSDCRVYTVDTVVSCCGDCNIMKYKWTEEQFLKHVESVAIFNRGKVFMDDVEVDVDSCAAEEEGADGEL